MRGAWIETFMGGGCPFRHPRRPSCEGRGLKREQGPRWHGVREESPLMRGAWIETGSWRRPSRRRRASPLMRGAWIETSAECTSSFRTSGRPSCEGRGLKLGKFARSILGGASSPLMRGAWIETFAAHQPARSRHPSPLMRGAWIETIICICFLVCECRRPSCEGRGLKLRCHSLTTLAPRRPSCEGRGLKPLACSQPRTPWDVAPHARGVD